MNMIEGYTRFLRNFHLIEDNEDILTYVLTRTV